MNLFRTIRFEVERFFFWTVVASAKIVPRRMVLFGGRLFGMFAYGLDWRHRAVAFKNLEIAFPEKSEKSKKSELRSCYQFFGASLFELLSWFPVFNKRRMNDFEYEGLENVDAAYARGKGAIFFTAHWGVWEQMAIAHGAKGYSLGVIARALDNPYLNESLNRLRRSTGNFVIDKNNGLRPMLRALREGKGLAILIDQSVSSPDRIFVNYFGRPASTSPILGYLKLRTDTALIPVFALPLKDGKYRFIYRPAVEVSLIGDRKQDVWAITQKCTQVIEEQIRKYPQFWLWMHDRWKGVASEHFHGLKNEALS